LKILLVGGGSVSSRVVRDLGNAGATCHRLTSRPSLDIDIRISSVHDLCDYIVDDSYAATIIFWSVTSFSSRRDLLRANSGFLSIAKFICRNNRLDHYVVSSCSAELELLGSSVYASSKYLLEKIVSDFLERCACSPRVHLLRCGLIYDHESCLLKRLARLRFRFSLQVQPGRMDARFPVVHSGVITQFVLESLARPIDSFEDSPLLIYLYERDPYTLRRFHSQLQRYCGHSFAVVTLDSFLLRPVFRIFPRLGDLSLVSCDRFDALVEPPALPYCAQSRVDAYVGSLT